MSSDQLHALLTRYGITDLSSMRDFYKRLHEDTYYPKQFERVPDEGLLDESNDTLKASLDDAGFGDFGPM